MRHSFLGEAADVRQAGVGSARAARLDRRRVGVQANDAHALVRLNAGGGHWGERTSNKKNNPTTQASCRTRFGIPLSLSGRIIGACRSSGQRNTRLVARVSIADALASHAASQSRRSAGEPPSDRSLRGERHRSDGNATILRSCRADLAVFRGCFVVLTSVRLWAVQVAPTPRIRPREVQRYDGSEAHGASKSRPSNLKPASVACWYGCAVGAKSNRPNRHVRKANTRPDARR